MRILVTGGAGFIGSNFVRHALSDDYAGLEGADVVVLDALTYSGNLENLAPVSDSPRYTFVHGDIRDDAVLDEWIPRVDAVVPDAAPCATRASSSRPTCWARRSSSTPRSATT
jgi:dTDP-glucose 4,6-dehydratase